MFPELAGASTALARGRHTEVGSESVSQVPEKVYLDRKEHSMNRCLSAVGAAWKIVHFAPKLKCSG